MDYATLSHESDRWVRFVLSLERSDEQVGRELGMVLLANMSCHGCTQRTNPTCEGVIW